MVSAFRSWLWQRSAGAAKAGGVGAALAACGWINTAGSAGPYVALHARTGLGRAAIDRQVFALGVAADVLAVRAGNMLVPMPDVPLALAAGVDAQAARTAKLAKMAGVTAEEIAKLGAAVARAMKAGPLPPDELRAALPAELVRSLGEDGRKLGDLTTLPVALRDLQMRGIVRRLPVDARLDTAKFAYGLWAPPVVPVAIGAAGALNHQLAARFLGMAGAATVHDFAGWAGVTVGAARAAMAACGAVAVAVEDGPAGLFALAPAAESLAAAVEPPKSAAGRWALLPFRDPFLAQRAGVSALIDPRHASVKIGGWNGKSTPLGEVASLHHHAVICDGRLAGVWEYDAPEREIVIATFDKLAPKPRAALAAVVEEMRTFIREDLGDLTFYALDHAAARAARVGAVLALT